MNKRFTAHIRKEPNTEDKEEAQYVDEHCRNTARYASKAMEGIGLEECAYLAGLVHDMGKCKEEFEEYIKRSERGEPVRKGSVNHTFAGVRYLLEHYHCGKTMYQNTASEILAYAAGSHHGLFDCIDDERRNGFVHRLEKEGIFYDESVAGFLDSCADQKELDQRFVRAEKEIENSILKIVRISDQDDKRDAKVIESERMFYVGMISRLLLSSVVEGDRRDTAEFKNRKIHQENVGWSWNPCLERVERKLEELPKDTELNRARSWISDQCRMAAENQSGIYRLNVPTGGGKTLSSLRFALAHSAKWKKKRIFFVSPLLSILDQNASRIRDYIQDNTLILEHHSNLVQIEQNEGDEESEQGKEELDQRELLLETWESPIVITTLVQLLQTLFSGKITSVRRFHSLCDSVIVIDEVQTVPSKMLSMFCMAVNFLEKLCGATIVLCSATQPSVEEIKYPMHGPIRDMVPRDEKIWRVFKRTQIQQKEEMSLDEIAVFAQHILDEYDSVLIVCNKKDQANTLFEKLEQTEAALFHLSASMCIQHRRDTLEQMENALKRQSSRKVICVSTQVIEAGIDISFQSVVRLMAGMDSVVQAAGRCNRNADAGPGVIASVYLIPCKGEKLKHLKDIQDGRTATESLVHDYKKDPAQFQNDLSSDQAIARYYHKLYRNMPKEQMDCIVKKGGKKDGKEENLTDLLAGNKTYADAFAEKVNEYTLRQSFCLAGKLFHVFDDDTIDVIVPYKQGEGIIAELGGEKAAHDVKEQERLLEKAKPYTVSLYPYQISQLGVGPGKGIYEHPCGALSLNGHYSDKMGFILAEKEVSFLEV